MYLSTVHQNLIRNALSVRVALRKPFITMGKKKIKTGLNQWQKVL